MTVDISKIKAGDTVEIVIDEAGIARFREFQPAFFYSHEIIAHKPKPFDWKDARPGMAFKLYGSNRIVWYIAPDFTGRKGGYHLFTLESSFADLEDIGFYSQFDAIRAPEHDLPCAKEGA